MQSSAFYTLIDTYVRERIDELLKIGARDEIHDDVLRALGERSAKKYSEHSEGKTYNGQHWLRSFKKRFLRGHFGS